MEKLTLVKNEAYAIWAEDDERGPSTIKGIYRDALVAEKNKKRIGWYGGDGRVEKQEVWRDEATGLIYIVKIFGQGYFSDDEKGQRTVQLEKIKSKLSPEERQFLLNNPDQLAKLKDEKTSINTEGRCDWPY